MAVDAGGDGRGCGERALRAPDPKLKAGLQVGGMMGRMWLIALAVILARYGGGKDDGIMAAALVLAAFTVYFVMSFFTRGAPLRTGTLSDTERLMSAAMDSGGRRRGARTSAGAGTRGGDGRSREVEHETETADPGAVWIGG